jgi:Peptidase family S41
MQTVSQNLRCARAKLSNLARASALPLLFLASVSGVSASDRPQKDASFHSEPWLEDFHQLLQEMSSHYANLEWALVDRGMDLPGLRTKTEGELQQVHNQAEARGVLDRFLKSFGDGHLELDWPSTDSQVSSAPANVSVCERLGYRTRGKPGIDYSLLSDLSPIASEREEFFSGGLLKLTKSRTLGLIHIRAFTEKGYPAACHQAVQQMGLADNTNCDENCADRVELAAANVLTEALVARALQLRRAGATALLIDITSNGGGSDWVGALARALTAKALRDPPLLFVKSDHWTSQLEDTLKDVEADLHDGRETNQVLKNAVATLERAIASSKEQCDANAVWVSGKFNCSILAGNFLFGSGLLSYAPRDSFDGFKSRSGLFYPSRYSYIEGANQLPLYILVDGNTWSAAEYFAALLQDNKAATIIGELTGGAGCGYTNGGISTVLKNSKAEVRMPDCVRLRADGTNEVNGVTPDILVPWARRDSPYQRVRKLMSVLQSMQ